MIVNFKEAFRKSNLMESNIDDIYQLYLRAKHDTANFVFRDLPNCKEGYLPSAFLKQYQEYFSFFKDEGYDDDTISSYVEKFFFSYNISALTEIIVVLDRFNLIDKVLSYPFKKVMCNFKIIYSRLKYVSSFLNDEKELCVIPFMSSSFFEQKYGVKDAVVQEKYPLTKDCYESLKKRHSFKGQLRKAKTKQEVKTEQQKVKI